jgi:hypothetical protein
MSAAPETVERSIRNELIAARDEVEKRETVTPEQPATKEVASEPIAEERPRDDHGRFAPKVEPEPQPAVAALESAAPPVKEPEPVAPVQTVGLAAPPAWSHATKAKWNELPAEVQQEIVKRELDVRKQVARMDDERAFGRELQRVIAPYEPIIRAEGGTPAAAVQDLLNTAYILRTGDPATKARLFAETAQRFGVDLSTLGQQQQMDPTVANLQREIAQLKATYQQQQQTEQQRAEQQALQTIEAFKSDPGHPHFDAVQAEMSALITAGAAKDLAQAYDMALWARPDLRQQLIAAQTANLKTSDDKRQKVDKARTKGVSVRGGPGGVTPPAPNPNASVRDDLMAALEEARSRI